MTDSFLWNDRSDILSCLADGRLITWYYPNAIYVDKDLMDLTKFQKVNINYKITFKYIFLT